VNTSPSSGELESVRESRALKVPLRANVVCPGDGRQPASTPQGETRATAEGRITTMVNIEAEKVDIERTVKRIEAAENGHDMEALLRDMTLDHIVHLCGRPQIHGRESVQQLYEGLFKILLSTNITQQQSEISASGDMAWDFGVYVNEYAGPDHRIREEGKYIGIYRKVDGKWKAAAFAITNNA
jgi:ketosteroid isomerase-like protein